jgi:hypothetical protein
MDKPMYEIITNALGDEILQRTDADGKIWTIPAVQANSDYQAYLASLDDSTIEAQPPEPVMESERTELADEPSSDTE